MRGVLILRHFGQTAKNIDLPNSHSQGEACSIDVLHLFDGYKLTSLLTFGFDYQAVSSFSEER